MRGLSGSFFICIITMGFLFACRNGNGSITNFLFSMEKESGASAKLMPSQLVKWVRDPENGLTKSKTIDNVIFSVQYKPIDYIVCEEERTELIADTLLKRKYKELEGMDYIDLKIRLEGEENEILKHNLNSSQQYQERVNYCAFKMQEDISLITGDNTLPCVLFHYERGYDASPEARFLLAFQKKPGELPNEMTLVINDKLFNKGLIKFTFNTKDILLTPKLEKL